jgi:NADH-quinone oxidoreductase subunit M
MRDFLTSIGYNGWVLHALLAIPLLGAAVTAVLSAAAAKRVAFGVALIELVVSLGLWWSVNTSTGTMELVSQVDWIRQWGIQYAVGIDGISLMMVLLTTLLLPLCVIGSWNYITKREPAYYALLLVLTTGMVGVFIATDLFLFYVFWEVMLVPMYFIIGVWGGKNRLYAALKFFVFTMAGSLLMLVAILVMVRTAAVASGKVSFSYYHLLEYATRSPEMLRLAPWLFTAFFLAFAVKVPMFPLHTWLPDAHVEAPTAGSVILASVLLKMGTYGFLRFAIPFFPTVAYSRGVQALVVTLAIIGVVYGALVAMVQPDVKKLVAYSSVSHLGFAMLGIWAATVQGVQGALMVMIGHGFSTGALFFLIGMIYERRHTREIAAFGGLAKAIPIFSLILTVVALASIGLPGLNGFIGEFLVLLGSFRTYPLATAIATTGVIFAAAYLLWALQRMIFNPLDKEENRSVTDLTGRELVVLVPLLAGIVWMGLYPKPVLSRMEPAARTYVLKAKGHLVRTDAAPTAPGAQP